MPLLQGRGHYLLTMKDLAGRENHSCGITQIVPCDFPGCHNGIVDVEENHRITK